MKSGDRVYDRDSARPATFLGWIDGMPLVQYDDGRTTTVRRVEPLATESDMEQQGQQTLF